MSESKSLAAKLLEAQQSVDAVVKRGRNVDQKYDYATAADVIDVSRKALHGAGLVSAITRVEVTNRRPFKTKSGTEGLTIEVAVQLTISDPEGPDNTNAHYVAIGSGADYGGADKSALKAQTAATKYAYANALALPFADHDPEKDVQGEAGRLPEQKADPEKALPDEKVEEIAKAVQESGIGFSDLSLLLGAVGADAPKAKRKDSIRKALAELTEARAEHFLSALDARVAESK